MEAPGTGRKASPALGRPRADAHPGSGKTGRSVEFGTGYVDGTKTSVFAEVGALAVLQGALQSAIGTLAEAEDVEQRFERLIAARTGR